MKRNNILLCPGGSCPPRHTCERYIRWMACDEDDADLEMDPAYDDGKCDSYIQIEYYGQ